MLQRKTDNINKASDGVKIWDVRTHAELAPPTQSRGIRGPVSCVVWIQQREPSKDILCYGTGLGYLAFWRLGEHRRFEELFAQRIGTGTEILAVAIDGSGMDSVRIVLATRDRLVQVHRLDSRAELHRVFSVQLNITVPRNVAFVDNADGDVYVFGSNGKMCVASSNAHPRILTILPDITSKDKMERSSQPSIPANYSKQELFGHDRR